MHISKNSVRQFSHNRGLRRGIYRLEGETEEPVREIQEAIFMGEGKDKPAGIEVEENHVYFYCPVMERESLELVRIIRRLDIEMKYLADRIGLESNPPIHLHIQSPGGDIFSGLTEGKVYVRLDDSLTVAVNDPVFVRVTAVSPEIVGAFRNAADGTDCLPLSAYGFEGKFTTANSTDMDGNTVAALYLRRTV